MSNITMSQIAEAAGVSQATVSFVLNGRERANGSISAGTSSRVQKIAQELGYHPNRSARALATGRSHLIGLCMWNLATAYYANFTRNVQSLVQTSDNHLLVTCLQTRLAEDDPRLFQDVFPWPLDGVLALDAGEVLTRHWNQFESWPAPTVNMGSLKYQVDNLDYVGVDLCSGVEQAIKHLFDIGCKDIAFAASEGTWNGKPPRLKTYLEMMKKYRRQTHRIVISQNSRPAAREGFKTHIETHGCPDGILCLNDEVALGGYRALCDLGIKVPQKVALVGCDGIEDTEYLECPITTIVSPIEEMCSLAWQMLQDRMQSPHCEIKQKVLLPKLAIRDSSLYFGGKIK